MGGGGGVFEGLRGIFLFFYFLLFFIFTSYRFSNLLICFSSFDFSCPILEKDYFIENVYIV